MPIETNKIQYGGDVMVFMGGTPIAFSNSAKLDISLKTRDIGSKDSGYWDEKAAGKMSWTMSSEALMADSNLTSTSNTYSDMFTAMLTRTPLTLVFATATGTSPDWTASSATGKTKFTGSGFITSLSMNASDGDNATYSISFEGTGALVMVA